MAGGPGAVDKEEKTLSCVQYGTTQSGSIYGWVIKRVMRVPKEE